MRTDVRRFLSVIALPLLVVVIVQVTLRGRRPVEVDSGNRMVMGTFSRVVAIARSERAARACIDAAFDVQDRIESLMSYHRDDSELNQVNRYAAEKRVAVNPMTFEVLREAARFSKLSDGTFDVTVGPLVDLWRAAGESNQPPSEEALAEARRKVGFQKMILDEKTMTVRFTEQGMRIDLGGIAKGYAVDKAVEAMKKRGAVGGMVDLGGNIRCFGRAPKGQEKWRIGVQDPNVTPDDLNPSKYLLVLELGDASVATSGDYRRFSVVEGHKQSHILDTHSGRGADKLVSDTIIAPDAISADALSTAVNILGPEAGMALVEKLPGIEAILIPAGDKVSLLYSSGARAYVRK
ncbi:MAG TPA: FAD:protein FMN transferase [Sedimentisphaerales bacterium]|nr:FAD:protein FMN transferase [Sedimentisphaerales bacterium]HNU30056.1 FAD:protein FMN transferase [Sedimentisphaerales bacterium]